MHREKKVLFSQVLRPILQRKSFELTLTIAFAAIRKSVARSLTILNFAANSGDGGSSISKSVKAR